VASFAGAALYLAAPWLVLFVSPAFVYVKTLGRALLGVTLVLFLVVPVWEMWFRKRGKPQAPPVVDEPL